MVDLAVLTNRGGSGRRHLVKSLCASFVLFCSIAIYLFSSTSVNVSPQLEWRYAESIAGVHRNAKQILSIKPSGHPIDNLIADAETAQQNVLTRETSTLAETARVYRERRGRHPPPRFDRWYAWAEKRGVLMIEDFFDGLYNDLEAFWDVSPQLIRDFPRSWGEVLSIRNGSIHRWKDEPSNIANWMGFYSGGFSLLPMEDIPDIDIAFNGADEPRLFVPWSTRQKHLAAVASRKAAAAAEGNIRPTVTDFVKREMLSSTRPPVAERTHYTWIDFDDALPLWKAAREACSPDSNAWMQDAPGEEDYTKPPSFPDHFVDHMPDGYVANWSDAKSACVNPDIRNIHGSFIAMQAWSDENPRPGQKAIITDLVPLLSGSKIHDINSEILIPAALQWPDQGGHLDADFNFAESERVSWPDKVNKVMWRGSASGGINDADNWTRLQRHRFLVMLNGSLVESHQKVSDQPLPAHVPGGQPPLPHNYPMPNTSLYPLAAMQSGDAPVALRDWIDDNTDAAFIHLRCYPPLSWFSGNGADCSYDGQYYTIVNHVSPAVQFEYRYQPDIDGASFSGRYRSLLYSNSAPIKATIYDEWHDSRLVPWKHFIPMDNTFMDWWGLMEYFLGYRKKVTGHDSAAEKIATEGSEWAQQALRIDDMLAYVYRLILELARLQDERRDHMGWAEDLA